MGRNSWKGEASRKEGRKEGIHKISFGRIKRTAKKFQRRKEINGYTRRKWGQKCGRDGTK
jgi:hypothetical protein